VNEEDVRRQVRRVQVEVGVDLGLALGHKTVARVVAKAALPLGRVDQTHELVPSSGLADRSEPGVEEKGAGQGLLAGDLKALTVEEGAAAAPGRVEIARDRIVDDADRDLAVLLEGDQ